jgi:hypothetical protein
MKKAFAICLAVTTIAVVFTLFFRRAFTPQTGAEGYVELRRIGRVHQGAWTGNATLTERFAALAHFTNASNYYAMHYEQQKRALIDSGYLVPLRLHIPNLASQGRQVRIVLTNACTQAGIYATWSFDLGGEMLELKCRKEDVAFWNDTLASYKQ